MPITSLFIEVAFACLPRKTEGVTPYLQTLCGQQLREDWPSWCIDMSSTHGLSTFVLYVHRAGCSRLNGDQDYFALETDDVDLETGVIVLRGFRADTVSERIFERFSPPGEEHPSSEALAKERACREITERTIGRMGEAASPPYLSTLTCSPVHSQDPEWPKTAAAYSDMLTHLRHNEQGTRWTIPIEKETASHKFFVPFSNVTLNRSRAFLSTSGGRIGNGPYIVQPGDHMVVIYGICVVLFLRTSDTRAGHMRFVGTGYVHGLMDIDVSRREEMMTGRYSNSVWEKFLVY